MKRITILLVVTALLAVPAGALSVKKKSIKRIANPTTTNVAAPTVYQQAVKAYEPQPCRWLGLQSCYLQRE